MDETERGPELENRIRELQEINDNMGNMTSEQSNQKMVQLKEECIVKDSENMRLKEKSDTMQQQIENFKQDFDSLQDYINLKEDQIMHKFQDEEVCISLQILLKELISISRQGDIKSLNLPEQFNMKSDLDQLIKNQYLTDAFVRFAIVNSVAYLQEWKDSLNYLKQKYAEAELKYDNLIQKYQSCMNENTVMQNNFNKIMEENQNLNEEKFYIMKSCIQQNQNQSMAQPHHGSFLQSYDGNHQMHASVDKENYTIFDDETTSNLHNQTQRMPMSSRLNSNLNSNFSFLAH